MVPVPPYVPSVTLIRRDGASYTFPSKAAAVEALGLDWIAHNVGLDFVRHIKVAFPYFDEHGALRIHQAVQYIRYPFVMRDDTGLTLRFRDFLFIRPVQKPLYELVTTGPIPGTRKMRGGLQWKRSPRLVAAMREAQVMDEDEPAPRAKRARKALEARAEGAVFESRRNNSWKRYRKHQWK